MIDYIRKTLFEMQDTAYRDFHSRLVPNLSKDVIIGVRTPQLRKFTKELEKMEDIDVFLRDLPHKYYEEINIHGFLIQGVRDFGKCVEMLEEFLPYIDNWATCDMIRPMCFKKHTDRLYPYVLKWINDEKPYTVRFAIGMLNSYYLDNHFSDEHLKIVSYVKSDEYYVKMMVAWYFATALTKQYESAVIYAESKVLDRWTHNKVIQKAIESHRVSDDKKAYLKALKY